MTNNGPIGNRYFELAQIPIFYWTYQKNKLIGRNKDNRLIIKGVIPFILISCFLTFKAYLVNPHSIRAAKQKYESGIELMQMGVGGYNLVYFLVILVAIMIYVYFNTNVKIRNKYRFLHFVIFTSSIIIIIISNFTTALLLLIFMFACFFFPKKINFKRILLFFIFPMFLLLIFSNHILVLLLDKLSQLLVGSLNASRIIEIKRFLVNNEIGFSILSRYETYYYSLQAFLNYPLFGSLIASPGDPFYNVAGLGNHSHFIDTFAFFGVGIGLIQLYIYLHPIKLRLKKINGLYDRSIMIIMLILIIILTLNVAMPSIGFALYFIFPTAYDWVHRFELNTVV